jgi:hypothetical protein
MVQLGRLRWMPAHLSRAATLRACKSNGEPVTLTEWRANRLADIVARRCALSIAVPRARVKQLQIAADSLRVEATVLGVVTKAANSHRESVCTCSGAMTTIVRRDSVKVDVRPADTPKRPWRTRVPAPPSEPRGVEDRGTPAEVQPRAAASIRAAAATRKRKRELAATENYILRDLLASRNAGARTAASGAVDGVTRFDALRRRVAARAAGATDT